MSNGWLKEDDIHWAYFLALEEDLHRLSRFVEISESNFSTHSIECARLLLASCSEAEVVLKLAAGIGRGRKLGDCFAPIGGRRGAPVKQRGPLSKKWLDSSAMAGLDEQPAS